MAEPGLLKRVKRKAPQNSQKDLKGIFTLVNPDCS
jgi:hypothetical protein